jgi:hypothetical protein
MRPAWCWVQKLSQSILFQKVRFLPQWGAWARHAPEAVLFCDDRDGVPAREVGDAGAGELSHGGNRPYGRMHA